jgi:hypothetical protein
VGVIDRTSRVVLGGYYTNGSDLIEVVSTRDVGVITVRDCSEGDEWAMGIDAFRRTWWLVRDPG